jgi:hypothetical protein
LPERSRIADAVFSIDGEDAPKGRTADVQPILWEGASDTHLCMGCRISPIDPHRNLHGVQRKHSMSTNGTDPIRLRQLRAIAENLCALANRHRDKANYLVAYALYDRALCVAQKIHRPEQARDSLVARITRDQQSVIEMLRSGESDLEKSPLEEAQKVGR